MTPSDHPSTRRSFIKKSALFGGLSILPSHWVLGQNASSGHAPSGQINLAAVGIGNKGLATIKMAHGTGLCNIVALCDVDLKGAHTQEALKLFASTGNQPTGRKAKLFTDFRKMFDSMADEIDAVLISTPDHAHFACTILAMSLGKHVYTEKPLTHTFGQAERLIQMAAKNPTLATQMGNQGYSGANYFQFKAWAEAGIVKDITRITAHMSRPRRWHDWGTNASAYPNEPTPEGLDWEQWQDSSRNASPFSKRLHPQEWRSWYDYGSGCFGDWGPHILDSCHHFLQLGLPETVTAVFRDGVNASDLVYPQASTIQFEFPERGPGLPACNVNWFDGVNNQPMIEGAFTNDGKDKILNSPGKVLYGKDITFQGGSHGAPLRIVPRQQYIDMRSMLPKFPQKNSDHYTNFLRACKGEEETRSPFSVAGPLTQVFNIGVLCQRFGGEIKFDREKKQITNNPAANALLDPAPRKGWEQYYNI
ncbi:MAG: Gfo/Idh/MocA family oxidoreductase [Verrucomicrobiae bacterium]|nr:Gfo/Idh/MocA family oxidoreductase [Verrucomicrobiae bacterium]NNJ43605.1 Gfo/Idh/MocA family oxidoreductase [Akkermansiaceae bacterium]